MASLRHMNQAVPSSRVGLVAVKPTALCAPGGGEDVTKTLSPRLTGSHCVIFVWSLFVYPVACRLVVFSGVAALVPMDGAMLRWHTLWGREPVDWYLWVSDPGSAVMGHRGSSSSVGRNDDMFCRPEWASTVTFICNMVSKHTLLVLRVCNGYTCTHICSCRRDSRLDLGIPG